MQVMITCTNGCILSFNWNWCLPWLQGAIALSWGVFTSLCGNHWLCLTFCPSGRSTVAASHQPGSEPFSVFWTTCLVPSVCRSVSRGSQWFRPGLHEVQSGWAGWGDHGGPSGTLGCSLLQPADGVGCSPEGYPALRPVQRGKFHPEHWCSTLTENTSCSFFFRQKFCTNGTKPYTTVIIKLLNTNTNDSIRCKERGVRCEHTIYDLKKHRGRLHWLSPLPSFMKLPPACRQLFPLLSLK